MKDDGIFFSSCSLYPLFGTTIHVAMYASSAITVLQVRSFCVSGKYFSLCTESVELEH